MPMYLAKAGGIFTPSPGRPRSVGRRKSPDAKALVSVLFWGHNHIHALYSSELVFPKIWLMADSPVSITEAVRALADKLPLSLPRQLDKWGGDAIKERRFRRLICVLEEVQQIAKAKGIKLNDMQLIADHVGLPWMHKASLRDDEGLQKAWANLFVAITTEDNENNEDFHGTCVHILGEMSPWDCKVLDYVIRKSVVLHPDGRDGYIPVPIQQEAIIAALASDQEKRKRTYFSIENLIRLSCLAKSVTAPIQVGGPVYSTLCEALAVSAIGVNLYCNSTGQELQSFAPVRTEDEIIDMLGLREFQIKRRPGRTKKKVHP